MPPIIRYISRLSLDILVTFGQAVMLPFFLVIKSLHGLRAISALPFYIRILLPRGQLNLGIYAAYCFHSGQYKQAVTVYRLLLTDLEPALADIVGTKAGRQFYRLFLDRLAQAHIRIGDVAAAAEVVKYAYRRLNLRTLPSLPRLTVQKSKLLLIGVEISELLGEDGMRELKRSLKKAWVNPAAAKPRLLQPETSEAKPMKAIRRPGVKNKAAPKLGKVIPFHRPTPH